MSKKEPNKKFARAGFKDLIKSTQAAVRSFMWQWDPYDVGEDRSINPNEYEDWVDELTKMIFSNVPEKAIIEAIHERMSREGLATSSKFENRFINEFAALKKTLDQAEQSSP